MDKPRESRWYERAQQVSRARALADLLAAADEAGLPPMQWTVNAAAGSCLFGEIDHPLDRDPQATFDAWAQFLDLRVNKRGDRASGHWSGSPRLVIGIHNPEQH
jgi:hypothetical protein